MSLRPYAMAMLLLVGSCASGPGEPTSPTPAEYASGQELQAIAAKELGGRSSCLVVTNANGASVLRTDDERCARPYRPFSTFKIPNSLIGLEAGLLADARSVVTWDPNLYPPQDWWPAVWTERTHDLRSAFRFSHVPYYRTLATQIGRATMKKYVETFAYGNQNISGSLDSFWLDGAIEISADQQIAFLRSFYEERLGVSAHSTAVVKDIFVRDRSGDAVLSAKTGTGVSDDGVTLAWLVGYVESNDTVHYFALNVTDTDSEKVGPEWRIATVQAVLASAGIWP